MQQQIIIQPEGSELIYEVLVSHDGGTVWVNCSDGNSVGRFSKHAGIDLHRTIAEQMAGGGPMPGLHSRTGRARRMGAFPCRDGTTLQRRPSARPHPLPLTPSFSEGRSN